MTRSDLKVSIKDLRNTCMEKEFSFQTTAELTPLEGIVGQERAMKAVDFGLSIDSTGYNIYLAGQTGTGKTTYALTATKEAAKEKPVPPDWVYVYNFAEPEHPRAFSLPAGLGKKFVADMKELVENLLTELPKAFDSEEYENQKHEVVHRYQKSIEQVISQLEAKAREQGFAIKRGSSGFVTVPLKDDGSSMSAEEFNQLSERKQQTLTESSRNMQVDINEATREISELQRRGRTEIKDLDRKIGLFAVGYLIDELTEDYQDQPDVIYYLNNVREDVVDHLEYFRNVNEESLDNDLPWFLRQDPHETLKRYSVNLIVDNSETSGAPVILESNPTYYNLFGKSEYKNQLGTMVTDFTMIKAGAIHRAIGGYLVLNINDILANPSTYQTLKRTIRTGEVRIESLGEQYQIVATAGLKPQPIPISLKVLLIGNRMYYHLLYQYDDEFKKLFKIRADFDTEMPRNREHLEDYARFISSVCQKDGLLHFDRSAVAKVVEHSSKLSEDQKKLSTRFNEVVEIVYEANVWARQKGRQIVLAEDVITAIRNKAYLNGAIEERIREMIEREQILIDVHGTKIGQVNGLSVYDLGDHLFGRPHRITARTFMGTKGIINIEREAKMSGSTHDKGILTLTGYLGQKYAYDKPLSLHASLTFEQLYSGIDGDSASSAELFALLSSLSGVPLRQGIAVTGSINQNGEIQPIGGVNAKIEGFYDICKVKGLTGEQGVIIPKQNVINLMLREDIAEDIKRNRFSVWAISTVDEGLEILTDIPAGEKIQGQYQNNSLHGRVDQQLSTWAQRLINFGKD